MAERVESAPPRRRAGRPSKWVHWADGSWWKLTLGEDVPKKPDVAGTSARAYTRPRGLRVEVRTDPDDATSIYVRFVPKEAGA